MVNHVMAKIIAEALFLSSLNSSIASVEMSSKFSVMNFAKDTETLQRAADALRNYIYIGVIWSLGVILSLYATHGIVGAVIGLIANIIMMGWIILSYIYAFRAAATQYNLPMPQVLGINDLYYFGMIGLAIVAGLTCTPLFKKK